MNKCANLNLEMMLFGDFKLMICVTTKFQSFHVTKHEHILSKQCMKKANPVATNAFAATAANFYSIKSPALVHSESDGATRRDRGRRN